MSTLFVWARPSTAFGSAEHTWATSHSEPFDVSKPPPRDYWYCFGGVYSIGDGKTRLLLEIPNADLKAARLVCKPNVPGASGDIRYAIDGINHQLTNRIIHAASRKGGQTVAGAKGYRVSYFLFGPYGRDLSDPQKVNLLYAGDDHSREIVEVIHTISDELMRHLKKHPEELHRIQPRQFEELIAELLAAYGWQVQLTPASKDGGYDLYAISKDVSGVQSHWIVECKKYARHRRVGVEIVRALYGVKSDLRIGNAMVATTSHFTAGAKAFKSSRYDLELKDYQGILKWIDEYSPRPTGKLYMRNGALILPNSTRSSEDVA